MQTVARERVPTREFAVLLAATFAVFTTLGAIVLALPLYVRDELGAWGYRAVFAAGAASGLAGLAAARDGRRQSSGSPS